MNSPLLPPALIGIVGGGQLGMMIVREAQRMGYRSVVWDPTPHCPASRLADVTITASFDDVDAAAQIASRADVVTYEFENIDVEAVRHIERYKQVFPGSDILEIAQHRRLEKEALRKRGFPVVPYATAGNLRELHAALVEIGLPAVVKTATAGYDGKGQTVLRTERDVAAYTVGPIPEGAEVVVEKFLDLQCEVSSIVVRSNDGTVRAFPVAENEHRNNILHKTVVPARVSDAIARDATALGREIVASFGMVGVLCIEMFVTTDGDLLVNELAPRPHNSGHYTLDACTLSQFEALVRAVCRLPVSQPELLSPCGMVNLLGKHLTNLDVQRLLTLPGVKLHLYGKKDAQPNRKMGHVTILRSSEAEVEDATRAIEEMIGES